MMGTVSGTMNEGVRFKWELPTEPQAGLLTRLFAPVDVASLVAFRMLFGAIMFWEVCRYFSYDWIRRYYIEPTFHFTYYGFSWVHPWPGIGMYLHFLALGLLAIFIVVGFWYRLSAGLFFLGFTYVFLLDQANYLNHFYFVCLLSFLLIFVPAHASASWDAWRRPAIRSEQVPAWSVWLLRAQLGIVYTGAGVAKLNYDWFRGEPMRMWLAESRDDIPLRGLVPLDRLLTAEWFVYLCSYGGLFFDLLATPALLWKRTRPYAFAVAVLFHLMNAKFFSIGIFPWLSIAATLIFFPPEWPRRIFNWPRSGQAGSHLIVPAPPPWRRSLLTFMGVYLAVQVLVPLRHFLYPGSVHWTEEGHRFSWHMKLRDKESTADFEVTDPARGSTWAINPRDYLSKRQIEKMEGRPDMILQFCHHVARELRRTGRGDVEVRAEVEVSLNGRAPQPLIDPTVDLARQQRNLRHASWILPFQESW